MNDNNEIARRRLARSTSANDCHSSRFSALRFPARWCAAALALLGWVVTPAVQAAGPVISGPASLTINEDSEATNVDFIVSDSVTPSFAIKTWATSSSQALISSNSLSVLGISKTRKLSFSPVANANGTATLTVFASNGSVTNSKAIALTVNAVNDLPSFSLASANITVLEDSASYTNAGVATTISRGPSNEASQTLVFLLTPQTPSNTNMFAIQPAIAVSGTNTTGTLTFRPALNQNGTAVFNVRLQDSGGTNFGGVNVTAAQTLTINITAVNDPPVILSTTNVVMNEDSTTNLVINVTDVDSPFSSNTSSNDWYLSSNTALLDPSTVTVTRNATNYTLAITPTADLFGTNLLSVVVDDGDVANSRTTNVIRIVVQPINDKPSFTLSTNALSVLEDAGLQTVSGFVATSSTGPANESGQSITNYVISSLPTNAFASITINPGTGALSYQTASNFNGSISITAKARDNGGTNSSGVNLSDPQAFTLNVTAVNDPPNISSIVTNLTMFEDRAATNTFVVTDVDTTITNVTLSATWDTNLINNVTFTGTGTNRSMIITPIPDANSITPTTLTITADDNQATNNTKSASIDVVITPVNDRPSFTLLTNIVSVTEDAGLQTLSGFIDTSSVGPSNESSQSITNYLVTTSSNAFFATLPSISTAGILTFRTTNNANGSVTVKVQARDDGGTNNGGLNLSFTNSFTVSVAPVNDAPLITGLPAALTMYEDRSTNITFQISDIDTAITNITLTVLTNSDTTTIPTENIIFSGTGTNRVMTVLAATNLNSVTPVTLVIQADDHGSVSNTVTATIALTVTPVNDAPSFTLSTTNVTAEKFGVVQTNLNFATSISKGPADESSQNITFTVTPVNSSLFSVAPAITATGTLTYTVANGANGSTTVSVYASDDGGTANGGNNHSSTNSFVITVPPNPFQYLAGEFNGLFYQTNGVTYQDAGFLKFVINTNGLITSGTVQLAGKQYTLTNGVGQFNFDSSSPTAEFTVSRGSDGADLDITVILDASNNWTESYTGTVASTDFTTASILMGDHAYKDTYSFKTDDLDSLDEGSYTVFLPGTGTTAPNGFSYGTVSVGANGTITLTGKLADTEVLAQTTSVSINGTWPLFANVYTNGAGGIVLGWITFNATSTNDLSGDVSWVKNADSGAADFAAGFANDSTLEGSVYTPPSAGQSAFVLSSGMVTFSHGGLSSSTNFTCAFPVAPGTSATSVLPATNNSLSVNNTTGAISGTFDNSGSVSFEGIVFQRTSSGRGYFWNTGDPDPSGSVVVGP